MALNPPDGAVAAPETFWPQHSTVSSASRSPHTCPFLADSARNVPAGGSVEPWRSVPQQATVSSVRSAQLKSLPEVMALNVPAGGSRR
jgi:hypothetical protein